MQTDHKVVSSEEWRKARIALLAAEKQLTRQRDEVSRLRRELPWEPVAKNYVFEIESGTLSLADLFDKRRQLMVQHFMFGPDDREGEATTELFPAEG